ncbi:MAG TPA: hypothetical protein VF593_12205 [Chthoniobacteraceae bacterium]|jgi:hypothetical protein
MDTYAPNPPKKGLGPLAWIGIGCGGIILLAIIGIAVFFIMFGGKVKEFASDFQKDPTRATATTMVNMSMGQIEMVKEDAANKRYTVQEKKSGKMTTVYWDANKGAPVVVEGDFSKIPAAASGGAEPTPSLPEKQP